MDKEVMLSSYFEREPFIFNEYLGSDFQYQALLQRKVIAEDALRKCSCTVEKHKAKQRQPALPLFRSQGNAIEKFIAVCYT